MTRVDLKANYPQNTLEVRTAHHEEKAPENTAEELYTELQLMARWLGLDKIDIMLRGNLSGELLRCSVNAV